MGCEVCHVHLPKKTQVRSYNIVPIIVCDSIVCKSVLHYTTPWSASAISVGMVSCSNPIERRLSLQLLSPSLSTCKNLITKILKHQTSIVMLQYPIKF